MYVTGVLQESWTTLVVQLKNFSSNYSEYAVTANTTITSLNESINMSGTVLSILPLLVLYLVFQKYFIESVDRRYYLRIKIKLVFYIKAIKNIKIQ